MILEIKSNRENKSINVYHSKNSKAQYSNTMTKDPNRIAQIFIDLKLQGFPIDESIRRYTERINKRDWLGL